MTLSTRKQHRDYVDLPPVPPCVPSVTPTNPGTGVVDLALNTTGCLPGISGYRLYRAVGSGTLYLLRDLGTTVSFRDINVAPGTTYRYAVSSYNEVNTESALSTAVQVTVTDTTPPAVPGGLGTTPGNQSLILRWLGGSGRDLKGYDVWMAIGSGGTYVKLNGSPLPAHGSAIWVQAGLANGQTYCFKVAAVDQQGNTSALSTEGCGVPGS
jgi:hypothetical protein